MLRALNYADVTDTGAILLGKKVVADAFYQRLIRVITHAHHDHIRGLGQSFKYSLFVIATPTTFKFLSIYGRKLYREKILELPYRKSVEIDGETITLYPARHIPGSAQVVVEGQDYRVGYTGDFKVPGTPPLQDLDVLVIDATYGSPRVERRWSDWEALAYLKQLIDEKIQEGPIWIYGYNGKLQEVMFELRSRGIEYPFYADEKTRKLAEIASEHYGKTVGKLYTFVSDSLEPGSVIFLRISKKKYYIKYPGIHITLTGWELRAPLVQTGKNTFNVSFSDHATFKEIIEYVREARPRHVVIDGSRGTDTIFTAKYIEKILGINATVRP
ncbi:MAG: MBL fold metallo-hydrolase [Desulfurococcales archaeon]|nr:MBL fold metallo-hydrolase [Desulfurococcales archaeon]